MKEGLGFLLLIAFVTMMTGEVSAECEILSVAHCFKGFNVHVTGLTQPAAQRYMTNFCGKVPPCLRAEGCSLIGLIPLLQGHMPRGMSARKGLTFLDAVCDNLQETIAFVNCEKTVDAGHFSRCKRTFSYSRCSNFQQQLSCNCSILKSACDSGTVDIGMRLVAMGYNAMLGCDIQAPTCDVPKDRLPPSNHLGPRPEYDNAPSHHHSSAAIGAHISDKMHKLSKDGHSASTGQRSSASTRKGLTIGWVAVMAVIRMMSSSPIQQ